MPAGVRPNPEPLAANKVVRRRGEDIGGILSIMRRNYVTTARIRATPDGVWKILADTARYAEWNPEIVGIEGRFAAGARFKARVKVKAGGGRTAIRSVSMRMTAFDRANRMEWMGGLPLGLFTGVRTLTLTARGNETEFRMELQMRGPLAGMILKSVGDRQPEIDSFSAALKARAEA